MWQYFATKRFIDFFGAMELLCLVPAAALGAAAALHSVRYLAPARGAKRMFYWLCFCVMLLAMCGVVFLKGRLAFLLAWEVMGLSSAGLVAYDAHTRRAQHAAWVYLMACQFGAAALMLAFFGSPPPLAGLLLMVAGFGLKAGFAGLHVWLPEAHPAAPAPVSALMSGAMLPLGFLGLVRFSGFMAFDARMRFALGAALLALGAATALLGALSALPQRDLKRLLAFSSVENMGILALALGLAAMAHARGNLFWCEFALAGFALHTMNHAFLKGALFLCAGNVYRAAHTLEMDRLGGLMRRMPFTGAVFMFSAVGLAGLPPLGVFFGEFFIYAAAFAFMAGGGVALPAAGLAAALALALCGGLSAAAYAKAVSACFLGEPRSAESAAAREAPLGMRIAAGAPALMHLGAIPAAWFPICVVFAAPTDVYDRLFCANAAFILIAAAVFALRFRLLPRARRNARGPAWDCGYAAPDARMQYNGTALTHGLAGDFGRICGARDSVEAPEGFFPRSAKAEVEPGDAGVRWLWEPAFALFGRAAHLISAPARRATPHACLLAMALAAVILAVWATCV